MGSLTIQIVGDVTVGTKSKTGTILDADINRLVAMAKDLGKSQGIPNPTTIQALSAYGDWILQLTKNQILVYEQNVANLAISPITIG